MHSSDFNYYSSYFAPTLTPLQPSRSSLGSLGSARMTGSPYPAAAPLHSTPSSRLGLGHFSPLDSYRTHSQQSPLRQASLGYSSDASATSAESPPSSSSANESPLPDPLIDNMDHDISAQVATGNDDYYPYVSDDMAAVGYPYGHHGSRPFPLPGYVVDPPDLYKQPVAAPLPLNLSLAMSYSWSPEAKKFQPLYPSLQQIQRQALDASQTSAQPSAVAPTHAASRPSCASSQPFGQEIEDINLVYPPQAAPRSYPSPPSQPQSSLTGYPQLRQSISVKQENDMRFPDLYNESAEVANCNSGMEVFGALFDTGSHNFNAASIPRNVNYSVPTGSPPVESSSTLDLAMRYAQTPAQPPVTQSSMTMPMLSAPVPRHSAYFGSSLVSSCERTCQEQEQEPDIQVLRVQTQGLQEQRTVRPAEVSPVMGFAGLPEAGDDDAEGEPDIEPFSLHDGKPDDGHRVARFHPARAEGVLDYVNRSGGAGASHRGHDFGVHQAVEGVDEFDEYDDRDLDNEYKVEEREDHDDDDGDGDFVPHRRATSKNTRSLRPRSVAGKNSVRYNPYGTDVSPSAVKRSSKSPLISASDLSPTLSSGQSGKLRKNARTLPVPIPVPNLTKKSRGRRVPTVHAVNNGGRGQRDVALGARIYLCDVSGCGKCFARGEHLKRHIRSIHTYEKPHKCPYPGCGKEFSRHDNLGQHMKVHKDYSKVLERMESGEV